MLRLLLFLVFVGFQSGCVKQELQRQSHQSNETYSKFSVSAAELFEKTSQFLAYDKGYDLLIQEPARGIIVSDWVAIHPQLRSRVTIRINRDVDGSILSIHRLLQSYGDNRKWTEEASDGSHEAALLNELRTRIDTAQR